MKKYLSFLLMIPMLATIGVKSAGAADALDVPPSIQYLMKTPPSLFDLGIMRLNSYVHGLSADIKKRDTGIKEVLAGAYFVQTQNVIQLEFAGYLENYDKKSAHEQCESFLKIVEDAIADDSYLPTTYNFTENDSYQNAFIHLPVQERLPIIFGNFFSHVGYKFNGQPKNINQDIFNKIRILANVGHDDNGYQSFDGNGSCSASLSDVDWQNALFQHAQPISR